VVQPDASVIGQLPSGVSASDDGDRDFDHAKRFQELQSE